MVKVKVYSTPTCPYCHKVKEWLKEKGVPFEDINVAEDQKQAEAMVKKSGQMGVPQIEIGDKLIVGYDPEAIQEALDDAKGKETKAAA